MHAETIALIKMLDQMEPFIGKADSNMLWTLLIDAKAERRAACEITLFALNFEIDSPQITPMRKAEAIHQRDTMLIQWGEIMTDWMSSDAAPGPAPLFKNCANLLRRVIRRCERCSGPTLNTIAFANSSAENAAPSQFASVQH